MTGAELKRCWLDAAARSSPAKAAIFPFVTDQGALLPLLGKNKELGKGVVEKIKNYPGLKYLTGVAGVAP